MSSTEMLCKIKVVFFFELRNFHELIPVPYFGYELDLQDIYLSRITYDLYEVVCEDDAEVCIEKPIEITPCINEILNLKAYTGTCTTRRSLHRARHTNKGLLAPWPDFIIHATNISQELSGPLIIISKVPFQVEIPKEGKILYFGANANSFLKTLLQNDTEMLLTGNNLTENQLSIVQELFGESYWDEELLTELITSGSLTLGILILYLVTYLIFTATKNKMQKTMVECKKKKRAKRGIVKKSPHLINFLEQIPEATETHPLT